jgi:O-methyltransferase involved in polyketide biosynthesis
MTASFDATKPNIARMYDYWLGGKDNFEADRKAAEAVRQTRPEVAEHALDNKMFQTRAVAYVAGQGVRQFLDIGSGLPTSPVIATGSTPLWRATHEAAETVIAEPVVAYVDNDPVAVLHSQALLSSGRRGVLAVAGDMRDPEAILANAEIRAAGLDLSAPVCVIFAFVLHFVDAQVAHDIVATFTRAIAPGSYIVISVGFAKGQQGQDFVRAYNAQNGARLFAHSWEEINGLFDGLELVPPGIVEAALWRPEWQDRLRAERTNLIMAGVARRN